MSKQLATEYLTLGGHNGRHQPADWIEAEGEVF